MAETHNFYLPGGDGNWSNAERPATLEAALERIAALEQALGYYSSARSYDPEEPGDAYPVHSELLDDGGLRARIGRLARTPEQYEDWLIWARAQK